MKGARLNRWLSCIHVWCVGKRAKSANLSRDRDLCPLLYVHLKALANEDTLLRTHLLPTQRFPRLPARATFVADTNFVCGTQILCPGHKKCFWFCSETFYVRNKCFPVCAAQETSWATMRPRLPRPFLSMMSWNTHYLLSPDVMYISKCKIAEPLSFQLSLVIEHPKYISF